jgi:hypothetical protein
LAFCERALSFDSSAAWGLEKKQTDGYPRLADFDFVPKIFARLSTFECFAAFYWPIIDFV